MLIHVTTRMNLENIMQSATIKSQNTIYCMIPFRSKSVETEWRLVVAQNWSVSTGL